MALSTDDLYEKALDLSSSVDDNFLDLGKSLRQLLDRDPELFKKVIDKSNIGSRKAYYLVNISRAFDPLQISKAKLKSLGWTKLQILVPHVTQENVVELTDAATEATTAQLKQIVKGEKPMTNAHCVLMYFSPAQYKELEETLPKFGATVTGRSINNKEAAIVAALKKAKASL